MISSDAATRLRSILRGPRIRRFATAALYRMPGRRVALRLPDGQTIFVWADGKDWVGRKLARSGIASYEPDTVPIFSNLAARASVVLDIGAHIGLYSLIAARVNPGAKVFAFEPVPEVFDRLRRNVLLNSFANVVCVRAAVGESEGNTPLFHMPGALETTASQRVEHRVFSQPGSWCCELVPTVTVDAFAGVASLRSVDLVKIDVEQAEPGVVRGMAQIIRQHKPTIICEVFPEQWNATAAGELEEVLAPHGYGFYLLTDRGPVRRAGVIGDERYWNQLFTYLTPAELEAEVRMAVRS
jgi:FkbM family methyltransferase